MNLASAFVVKLRDSLIDQVAQMLESLQNVSRRQLDVARAATQPHLVPFAHHPQTWSNRPLEGTREIMMSTKLEQPLLLLDPT